MGYGLLFYFIAVFPFWVQSAPGWAFAVLVAWFLWWLNHPKKAKTPAKPSANGFISDSGLHDLILLRLELNRLRAAGKLETARYEDLCGKLDQLWSFHIAKIGVITLDATWIERRETAWKVLESFSSLPLGIPPWDGQAQTRHEEPAILPTEPVPAIQQAEVAAALAATESPHAVNAAPAAITRAETEAVTAAPAAWSLEPLDAPPPTPAAPSPRPPISKPPRENYAWQPAEPSALEKAMKAVSGWSAWLVPFLVQNIGWFIGGLCFVAGSIFLVAYTGGFAKALAVFFVLLSYSLLLLWGGWQIRRTRPEQIFSSGALLTLSILLLPLNLAAAVRMWLAADSMALTLLALLVTVAYAYACHWMVTLASGMIDRSLQAGHPRLFLSLAATQLTIPLLGHWPVWPLLAAVHLALLGILGHALRQFVEIWLRSVFIGRRKIAYYAAGTLVYAALVSFVHTTWGVGDIALPTGYAGPFLMALAGLLFIADAEFKHWSEHHAYLSRFSFVLYGLSAVALSLVFGTFWPAILTLLLGLGIYASVVWRYLSFPPLALFLVCVSWLYALLVLSLFKPQWHLLLSLPGLAGLHGLSRRRLLGRSAYLAGLSFWFSVLLLAGLLGWSLAHSQPGWIALATVATVLALAHYARRLFPATPIAPAEDGRRIYVSAFLHALALAYAPLLAEHWALQFGFGLVALACVWTGLGLVNLRRGIAAEPWLNCAVLALLTAMGFSAIVWQFIPVSLGVHALLWALAGSVWVWLSLSLYARALFYAGLLALGVAGAICKLAYFPAPSTGSASFGLALGLCVLSWWLEQSSLEVGEWRRENRALLGSRRPSLLLLGFLDTKGSEIHSSGELLCQPLRQAAGLLWFVGLLAWLARLGAGQTASGWVFSGLLGAACAVPLAGYFRIRHWPPAPMLLVLGALLGWLDGMELDASKLCMATVIYAGLAWRGSVALIAHPLSHKIAAALCLDLGLDSPEQRLSLEQDTHYTGFAVSLAALALLLGNPLEADIPVMAVSIAAGAFFIHASGWRYRLLTHSYLVLALAVIALGLAYLLNLKAEGLNLSRLGGSGSISLSALALAFFGLSCLLTIRLQPSADGFEESLYRKPLRVTGLLLAWAALVLALRGVAAADMKPDLSTIAALGLADLALLLNNRRLEYRGLDRMGILLAALDLLWLALYLRHGAVPFDPWNDPHGDLWTTLALLALGLAWLGRSLRDWYWGETVQEAFLILAVLLGLRILIPLAPAAFAAFLIEPGTDFPLASVWISVLLGLALPLSRGFGRPLLIHAGLAAWACVGLTVYLGWERPAFHPPLLCALACAGLLGAGRLAARWPEEEQQVRWCEALEAWTLLSLWASLALLPRFFFSVPAESLWTLLLAAGLAGLLAHKRRSIGLAFLAVTLTTLLLHGWLWVWLKPPTALVLLPWYCLQWSLLLLAWPYLWQYRQGERRAAGWRGEVQRCAAICRDGLVALLVIELALHGTFFLVGLQNTPLPMSPFAHGAALLAGAILLGIEITRLEGDFENPWLYSLTALGLALLVYVRLLCLGLAAPGLWDTAGLVALTFFFATLHSLTGATAFRRFGMWLPLAILLTVRWELASTQASFNLMLVAGLYLWLSRAFGLRLPAYLGLLLLNIAIYLWIPRWAKQAGLLQIYLVPAAGSVLLMLQLHRRELSPAVLNAGRLATTSLLYGCASLDVFLRPGLGVFVLALGLSLASVAVGISLRVRAFAYSGMVFLTLNIAGQLGQLYPEGRLARAVVLMGLGSAIFVAMIFFQLKREEVLRKIRLIRADLAGWE